MTARARSAAFLDDHGLDGVRRDLERRWAEPHRRYHDLEHLDEMLGHVESLGAAGDLVCHLATWFHDAILEPARSDNEERSAVLATDVLIAEGRPAPEVDEIASIVRATRTHEATATGRTAVVLDADMAILAAEPERYRRYLADVRLEYGHFDDATFTAGRRAFVEELLGRPRLFATPHGVEQWEAAARRNLSSELD